MAMLSNRELFDRHFAAEGHRMHVIRRTLSTVRVGEQELLVVTPAFIFTTLRRTAEESERQRRLRASDEQASTTSSAQVPDLAIQGS